MGYNVGKLVNNSGCGNRDNSMNIKISQEQRDGLALWDQKRKVAQGEDASDRPGKCAKRRKNNKD